jgi:hypothetical protein
MNSLSGEERMMKNSSLFVAATMVGVAVTLMVPARASIIGTPDNSAVILSLNGGGGGNIPNNFFDVVNYVDPTASASLQYENVPAYGSGLLSGSVDHIGQTLRLSLAAQTQSPQIVPGALVSNSHAGSARILDRILVTGFTNMLDSILVTATMVIDGSISAGGSPGFDSFVDVNAVVNLGGSSGRACVSTRTLADCSEQSGAFVRSISVSRMITAADPYFNVSWGMQANATSVDGFHLADLSNTARIALVVPVGYSFESESGFLTPGQAVPIPEPLSAAILVGGIGMLGLIRRRRAIGEAPSA